MSVEDLHVRHAGLADLGVLIPLFRDYLDSYGRSASEPDAGAFLAGHLDAGTSLLLLAEHEGEPVGFAQLYPCWQSLTLRSSWNLQDLYVEPAARRAGVGRALVTAALEAAGQSGAGSVSASAAPGNEGAQALYESLGFGRDEAAVVYERALSR